MLNQSIYVVQAIQNGNMKLFKMAFEHTAVYTVYVLSKNTFAYICVQVYTTFFIIMFVIKMKIIIKC